METQTTNNFEFHNVSEHSPIGPPNRQPINKYIHINIFIYTSMCTYIKSKQRLFSYSLCSRFVKTIKNWEPKNHTPKVEKIVPPPSRSTTRRSGRSRTIVPPRPGGPHPKPWPGPEGHQLFLSFRCWFFKRLRLPSGSTGSGRSRTIVPPRPGGPHPKPWPGPEGHQLFLSFRCWFFKRLRLPSGSTVEGVAGEPKHYGIRSSRSVTLYPRGRETKE